MVQTPKIDTDKVKDSAAEVAAALVGAGSRAADGARDAAGQAKDWASPRYDAFVEWLRPRAEKAWNDSVQAAAPRVEQAATKAGPLVDSAHDKIVEEYLPKLVVAFNAAAARAGATAEEVAKAAKKAAKEAEKAAKKEQRKGRRRKALVWTAVLGGTAAAGYAFYRRAQPQNDPWAEPWEQSTAPDFDGAARDARHVVGDAAEAVGEAAGAAVAKGKEATEKLSEKAAEVREDVAARTTRARKKTEDAAAEAEAAVEDAGRAVEDKADDITDDKK
ncbi:hypothetical protein [Isoptericola dokdonensis]|jgi:colicin import membrane protein|uniref:Apolipoprotein A1/A4/E domain protein n=1 Tax=Isoptericola dokdonensis DS-3 TaxID=1300344 RepID=A0A161HRS0_9MICO|nr:hypothetical protein [Isoptericola dokdonensis]ANC32032.1 hypothetical protein I598_2496 [Isoptericola dokdonensis DS-3]